MIIELLRTLVMMQAVSFIFFIIKNPTYFNAPTLLKHIQEINKLLIFMHEHNPLLVSYNEDKNEKEVELELEVEVPSRQEFKYETKYLEKFKKFSNDFLFTHQEQEEKNLQSIKIKTQFETEKEDKLQQIKKVLLKIDLVLKNFNITEIKEIKEITKEGKVQLLEYFEIDNDTDDDDPNNNDDPNDNINDITFYSELLSDLLIEQGTLLKELETVEKIVLTDEEIGIKSNEYIVNKKLDQYINNYILEHTPLGNVIMRYNNDKKSFEYFSNSTIPYRYLEPIGRKYVMTYWCKSIFIDIEEELKKAEEKYDDEQKEKEKEKEKEKNEGKKSNFKVQFKTYNKDTKDQTTMPMKNRSNNHVLPPQIKANLPDVNKQSEKMLLKEHANRYTWEGRLTSFELLKKIDKKKLNKQLSLTYADYKKNASNK